MLTTLAGFLDQLNFGHPQGDDRGCSIAGRCHCDYRHGRHSVPDNAALSTDERAELQRLRAEVAELRSQAAAEPAVSDQTVVTAPPASPMAAVAFRGRDLAPPDPSRWAVGSQHVDAEPVMLGERGRLRMQRHRQLRCDVAFDDGFGGVVDDRARHPTEMREGPPVTVPESGQISMSVRSHASINGMNGVISLGCVPARGGLAGRRRRILRPSFRTVRQSPQPHSRPISANVAPAACKRGNDECSSKTPNPGS